MRLGEIQKLKVCKKVDFGVYLCEEDNRDERVLLPKKVVPEGIEIGDEVEVFLYKDSDDRLIATTAKPKVTLHNFALLTVKEVTKIGAFWTMDWKRICFFHIKK